jgi:hypothetical protein
VSTLTDIENRARLSRTTCGWRKPGLDLDSVRNYWRDVHSPAISRRLGIYTYRHCPFDAVRPDVFGAVRGVERSAPADAQLQWQSDVAYLDDAGLAAFLGSPSSPEVTAELLADIEMIVEASTTYKSVGGNLWTHVDRIAHPKSGPSQSPRYGLFFRSRADEPGFRTAVRTVATRWAGHDGVLRLRMNLFDKPDMAAERKAGYPVKTHPEELQYQAWIDLVVEQEDVTDSLAKAAGDLGDAVAALHAYPVPAMYTFVFQGRPTILGLRGYAASVAIDSLDAKQALDERLLEWMYGPIVHGKAAAAS